MMQINNGLGIFYVIFSYIGLLCKICIRCVKWMYINNMPPFVLYVCVKNVM